MALREICKKCKKCKKLDPKIWIGFYVLISAFLLYWYPPVQVSHFEINNATIDATLENQYRATLAQILGGGAVAIGIYFAWNNFKIAQENLKVSKEGQITERFTRAIEQLGNPNLEIRLGGIYALERISNESDGDYWPIIEILTAVIRKNSCSEYKKKVGGAKDQYKVPMDIQAILTVIGRRKYSYQEGETNRLDLHNTCLERVNLKEANFEGAWLDDADLVRASLDGAYLKNAYLEDAKLILAYLDGAHLERAFLKRTEFMGAQLQGVNFEEANILGAYFGEANLQGANFEKAKLIDVHLKGAKNLTFDQLSKVKTLYGTELDEELEIPLRKKFSALFEKPDENEP